MFTRLKRFFSDIKNAIKRLIFGEKKEESKTESTTTTTTKTKISDDGIEVEEVKIEVVNPDAGSWSDIFKKIGTNIKNGVNYCVDYISNHPIKVLKAITVGGIATTTVSKWITTFDGISRMRDRRRRAKIEACEFYDNRFNSHYTTKRPLTSSELKRLNLEREKLDPTTGNYRGMGSILAEMGLI